MRNPPHRKSGALPPRLRARSPTRAPPARRLINGRCLPNARAGVAGGYDVDTVWIINSKQQAWFDALPAESQKLLADADAAEQKKLGPCPISNHLKDLPYTSTFEMSPDAQLVGYLSQHTTHAVLQAKPEIDALMAK